MNPGSGVQKQYSVLVVEPDDALRILFSALLQRTFAVECVADGAAALERLRRSHYDVLVLEPLASGAGGPIFHEIQKAVPGLLRRTIVTTAANEKFLGSIDRGVYAVVRKPLDIGELTRIVSDCASQARVRRSIRDTAEQYFANRDEEAMHRSAKERFELQVPELRRLLRRPETSPQEMLLRSELRRVVNELHGVLREAASSEPDPSRAHDFARLARKAGEIVTPQRQSSRRDH